MTNWQLALLFFASAKAVVPSKERVNTESVVVVGIELVFAVALLITSYVYAFKWGISLV